ncbi:BZ3501_MvSof-1269-A2-R1_Chr11g02858 [Microbotryum saponariae]|nr:BZ3501_MvSof-1269-A2-R1_Chr11g02858 [Microbotryum saponariae]
MAPSNYHVVTSPEHLQQVLSTDLTLVSVLYFRADWAETCQQMDQVVQQLVQRWDKVLFLSIEAESLPDISESFEVDAVPYFILLRVESLAIDHLGATDPSPNALRPQLFLFPPPRTTPYPAGDITATRDSDESDEDLTKRCHELMKQSDVVLFMKGDRKTPRCGFSSKIVNILNEQDVEFTTFDILSDDAVRQKLKDLNEWPTFPQLIIKGEFVGGLDVVKEMVENGELKEMLA